jgi:hypothetical protein
MTQKIIFHDSKDITYELLMNEKLVLIFFSKHRIDYKCHSGEIISCTPKYFYLALKEDDKYKLITRNDYDNKYKNYVKIKKDSRTQEKNIQQYVFKDSNIYVVLKPYVNDKKSVECVNIMTGLYEILHNVNVIEKKDLIQYFILDFFSLTNETNIIEKPHILAKKEILEVKQKITEQKKIICKLYQVEPFSIINLDAAMFRKNILKDKFKRLKKLYNTLFS